MKTTVISLLVPFLLLAAWIPPEKKNHLNGAYLAVSFKYIRHDSVILSFPEKVKGSELKIWSNKHFSYSGINKFDTISFDVYGGGIYTLDGDHYTEQFDYSVDKTILGTTIKFIMKIDHDTLTQIWPVDENWNVKKEEYYVQKLVRAD